MSGGWRGSTRASRLPKDWPKRRAAVLKRDRGICHVCKRPGANEVDHIQPGDNHNLENLGAIHGTPCHRDKTLKEARAAQVRRSPKRVSQVHPGLRGGG